MWYKNVGTSFFRFVTNHAFDNKWIIESLTYLSMAGTFPCMYKFSGY